eukprot:UN04687
MKFSNTIVSLIEMLFGSHGIIRKRSEPIWMYIECFTKMKKSIFINFSSFLNPRRRLRPEIF